MSLTRDEVGNLLSIAAAYDGREPSEALMVAWIAQAEIGRWSYEHAVQAIHNHFANSEAYLMPIHITTLVRQQRNLEAERREAMKEAERVAALPAPSPARAEHVRTMVDQIARDLSFPVDQDGHYAGPMDSPRAIKCPWEPCHAPAGVACRSPRGRPLTQTLFHDLRAEAWKERQEGLDAR